MGGRLVSAGQRREVQVATFGESMVLLDAAAAGPPTLASSMHVRFAGAESNFAIGLARLGVPTEWISRVGADPFGEIILDTLRREGVDVGRCTVDGERRTGLFVKWRDGSTTHRHYYRDDSAASVLRIDDVRGLGAEWVHLTGITLGLSHSAATAVAFAAREAKQSGATVSFDLNYRAALWPDERAAYRAVQAVLPWTDWVLCGLDEGRALVGPRDGATPASLVARLRADGATGVLVNP
jgi:2-dehydro-3-deoxygluconokinase